MIEEITYLLAAELSTLPFVDRAAGVVRTAKRNVTGKNGTVEKRFPVYINLFPTQCEDYEYIDLCPDEKRKGIVYFEETSNQITEFNNRYTEFTSTVKLVCWFNLRLIDYDLRNCSLLQVKILDALPKTLPNIDYITMIRVNVVGEEIKNSDIFSNYTFNEAERQYLLYPFDYCAFDLEIKYRVAKGCSDELELKPCDCKKIKYLQIDDWVVGDCSIIS